MEATYVKDREATLREQLDYPHHRHELLEESGIDLEVVLARGYRTVKCKAELQRLGFSASQQLVPALLVPMYSPSGKRTTYQIKPDKPRHSDDGKSVKYETPTHTELHLDVHPSQAERVNDPKVPLWVTEGV